VSEKNSKELEKPLRIISPKLYRFIISEFEKYNIHSYDLLINGIKKDQGMEIILRFGETFSRKKSKLFSDQVIKGQADELRKFIENATEACKKAMIDDYFERMAP